jgi:hypothetical protein
MKKLLTLTLLCIAAPFFVAAQVPCDGTDYLVEVDLGDYYYGNGTWDPVLTYGPYCPDDPNAPLTLSGFFTVYEFGVANTLYIVSPPDANGCVTLTIATDVNTFWDYAVLDYLELYASCNPPLPVTDVVLYGHASKAQNVIRASIQGVAASAEFIIRRVNDDSTFTVIDSTLTEIEQGELYEWEVVDRKPPDTALYQLIERRSDGSLAYHGHTRIVRESAQTVKLYPVPAQTSITLEFDGVEPGQWMIYDAAGRMVKRGRTKKLETHINVAGLPNGLYRLKTHHYVKQFSIHR